MSDPTHLRVLIADDELPARQLLRSYVEARPDLLLAGEASDGDKAVALIALTRSDLVLLDIEMPGLDGFGVLLELTRRSVPHPHVIFVTAFDRYAVRAFEINAVDYLVKPVTARRFHEAIDRSVRRTKEDQTTDARGLLEDALRLPPKRLLVRDRGRVVAIPTEAIDWLEAERDYVRIHVQDRSHLIERTLTQLERVLEPLGFIRIHRTAIVNRDRVRELQPEGSGRYRLLLTGGQTLPVSRSYAPRFKTDFL